MHARETTHPDRLSITTKNGFLKSHGRSPSRSSRVLRSCKAQGRMSLAVVLLTSHIRHRLGCWLLQGSVSVRVLRISSLTSSLMSQRPAGSDYLRNGPLTAMSWDAHTAVGRFEVACAVPTRSQHLQVYSKSNRRHPWEILYDETHLGDALRSGRINVLP